MTDVASLHIKLFADGANIPGILDMYHKPYICGFTTNPTLMHKAGVKDYRAFAHEVVTVVPDRPISFEVFADDAATMERQAREITRWGEHVYVKIPITNTQGVSMMPLVHALTADGIKVNVTALMTLAQVEAVAEALVAGTPSCVSVFAGRIADTGRDPLPLMQEALTILKAVPQAELIWASPRELLNVFQADAIGCHIITVTNDILKKIDLAGKDLDEYSLETVKMFHSDAVAAGLSFNYD